MMASLFLLDIREMKYKLARELCKIMKQNVDCTHSALVFTVPAFCMRNC